MEGTCDHCGKGIPKGRGKYVGNAFSEDEMWSYCSKGCDISHAPIRLRLPPGRILQYEEVFFCSNCGISSQETQLRKCGRCRNERYCSRDCQKAKWPEHKKRCV